MRSCLVAASLLVMLAPAGCNDVAGLEGLRFGSGAGPAGGVPAADWTSAFAAVYLFEPDSIAIGEDATGDAPALTTVGSPTITDTEKMQGEGALRADGTNYVGSSDAFFDPEGMEQLTVGGWFRVESSSADGILVHKTDGTPFGYQLARLGEGSFSCSGGNQATSMPPASWPDGDWMHLVCVFDPISGDLYGYAAGLRVLTNTENLEWRTNGAALGVGGPGDAYEAQIDELFFIDEVLDEVQVRRIHACGIDGSSCRCDENNPSSYASCGRTSDCVNLPPCDQAQP